MVQEGSVWVVLLTLQALSQHFATRTKAPKFDFDAAVAGFEKTVAQRVISEDEQFVSSSGTGRVLTLATLAQVKGRDREEMGGQSQLRLAHSDMLTLMSRLTARLNCHNSGRLLSNGDASLSTLSHI